MLLPPASGLVFILSGDGYEPDIASLNPDTGELTPLGFKVGAFTVMVNIPTG